MSGENLEVSDGVIYIYQVMRVLLRLEVVDVNAKNYQGLTTLDLVMRLPSHEDNGKAVSVLPRRAKTGSSITQTPLADYFHHTMGVVGDYLETGISDQMRSAALVVSALIATTAYQGVLSPPGIVSTSKPTPSTLYKISKSELTLRDIVYALGFKLPDCCALAASLGMIYLLLPVRLSILWIHSSLLFLMMSTYAMLASTEWWQPKLKVGSSVGTLSFGIVIFLVTMMKIPSLRQRLLMKRLMVRNIADLLCGIFWGFCNN